AVLPEQIGRAGTEGRLRALPPRSLARPCVSPSRRGRSSAFHFGGGVPSRRGPRHEPVQRSHSADSFSSTVSPPRMADPSVLAPHPPHGPNDKRPPKKAPDSRSSN